MDAGKKPGWTEWALGILALVLLIVVLLMAYYMVSATPWARFGTFIMAGVFFPFTFFYVALISFLLLWLAYRKDWKLSVFIFSICAMLGMIFAIWPWLSLRAKARDINVKLSLSQALVFKSNQGDSSRVKQVIYGKGQDSVPLSLDFWPVEKDNKGAPRPAIVKIHGGGWVRGSRKDLTGWNSWFNELGYQVFDVDYRLPPPARWMDEVGDIKSALGWIFSHAAEYNIDTNRISLFGCSAGAHLAMMTAYSYDDPQFPPSFAVQAVPIKCVIDMYGPAALPALYNNTPSPDYVRPSMKQFLGGSPTELVDRYNLLSPISFITRSSPPTFIIQGVKDRVVPMSQSVALSAALSKAGVANELYLLPATDHGFDANWNYFGTQIAREKIRLFLEKYGK